MTEIIENKMHRPIHTYRLQFVGSVLIKPDQQLSEAGIQEDIFNISICAYFPSIVIAPILSSTNHVQVNATCGSF